MSRWWTIQDVEKLSKKKSPIKPDVKISANDLTKSALKVLDLKGYHVWRQNTAGVYDQKKKVFRKGSATKGISDILGFHRKTGKFLACEIKVGSDVLSPDQEYFLDCVRSAGGLAMVIRRNQDVEELNKILP